MKKLAYLLLIALLPGLGVAGMDASISHQYKILGVVDRVNLKSGEIVINDMFYRLGPSVIVRDKKNRIAKPGKLRQGSKIGANSYGGASYGASNQYIHEIRLLPDNFDLNSVSEDDD